MGGAAMADIFIRTLPKYAPDLIVLLGLYLLLLGRWKKQGRRRVLVAFAPEGLENGRYQGLTGGAI